MSCCHVKALQALMNAIPIGLATGMERVRLREAMIGAADAIGHTCSGERVVHGKTCAKYVHALGGGYLHADDDDSPYDVDGVTYCGRCHTYIGAQP